MIDDCRLSIEKQGRMPTRKSDYNVQFEKQGMWKVLEIANHPSTINNHHSY